MFSNNIAADVKQCKSQISKVIKSGGFWSTLLSVIAGSFMKVAVPFVKNVLAP